MGTERERERERGERTMRSDKIEVRFRGEDASHEPAHLLPRGATEVIKHGCSSASSVSQTSRLSEIEEQRAVGDAAGVDRVEMLRYQGCRRRSTILTGSCTDSLGPLFRQAPPPGSPFSELQQAQACPFMLWTLFLVLALRRV